MRAVLLLATVLVVQAQSPVPQAEIRASATKSIALLDTVNRTWLKQACCYSCHNDGLFKEPIVKQRHPFANGPLGRELLGDHSRHSDPTGIQCDLQQVSFESPRHRAPVI